MSQIEESLSADSFVEEITIESTPKTPHKRKKNENKEETGQTETVVKHKRRKIKDTEKEAIATCIEAENVLWDKRNPKHHHTRKIKEAWQRVSKNLDISGNFTYTVILK